MVVGCERLVQRNRTFARIILRSKPYLAESWLAKASDDGLSLVHKQSDALAEGLTKITTTMSGFRTHEEAWR
jgi:hypothetical protein